MLSQATRAHPTSAISRGGTQENPIAQGGGGGISPEHPNTPTTRSAYFSAH